jgi:hypothetical protein
MWEKDIHSLVEKPKERVDLEDTGGDGKTLLMVGCCE